MYTVGENQEVHTPITPEQAEFLRSLSPIQLEQGAVPSQEALQALYRSGFRDRPGSYQQAILGKDLDNALATFLVGALIRYMPSLLFSYEQVPIATDDKKGPGWKRVPKILLFGTFWNVLSTLTIKWVLTLGQRFKKDVDWGKFTGMTGLDYNAGKIAAMTIGGLVAAAIELILDSSLAQKNTGIRPPLIYAVRNAELGEVYKRERKKAVKQKNNKKK